MNDANARCVYLAGLVKSRPHWRRSRIRQKVDLDFGASVDGT